MNYLGLYRADIANGTGWRTSLFVSGCSHKCPHCQNPQSWSPDNGKLFDEEAKSKLLDSLDFPWVSGLTLTGGDPLYSGNRQEVIDLCREVKEKYPEKNIWLYTGFTYEQIANDETMRPILDFVDVLVDGRFEQEKKDLSCPWRGSSNQRLIAVKSTLAKGRVVEMPI